MAGQGLKIAERALGMRSPKFGEIAAVRKFIEGVEDVIHLGYGEPDLETPEYIKEAGKRAIEDGHTHYVLPVEGLTPLRAAIAEKLDRVNKIDADPNSEILVTSGVQEGINVALQTIIDPGDEVIMPNPYYYADPLGVLLAGGVPIYTELKEERHFRINPQEVRSKITDRTKAIFFINPNCPTGSVFSKEDLEEIAQIAIDHDLFILTDEIYEHLVYDGVECVSIASLPDIKDRTISMFGFSKTYAMTGWRVGYTHAPSEVMKNMIEIHSQMVLCTNAIAQHAALAALTESQATIEDMRCKYERRRNVLINGLQRLGFRIQAPKGAFYAYANISELGLSGLEVAKRLARDAKVLAYPGTAFTYDNSGEDYVRFSYTSSTAKLHTAIDRMEKVVNSL